MGLNPLQAQILNPFIDQTISCLESMAGFSAHSGEGFQDDLSRFKFKGYAIAAETTGVIEGKILMHHYIETALSIGNSVRNNLLGDDADTPEMNMEIGEALAEFGNTAIGLATHSLEKSNLGIKFKPPYFITNTEQMDKIIEGVKEILSIPIHVENVGRFYFNFLLINIKGT